MAYDKFFIGPFGTGLQKDIRPWLLPEDGYEQLNNAFVFRGRVVKRLGSELINNALDVLGSRLRIQIGTTNGAGNLAGTVPGTIFKVGQMFSIADSILTVSVLGTPGIMLTTNPAIVTRTYNTTTGAYVIAGAPANTPVYFYPAEPVMGIYRYDIGTVSTNPTYFFDTQFAYEYTSGAFSRLGTALWTGNNTQFFWAYTYRGLEDNSNLLFVSNFNVPDVIKYWDGATWTNFNPQFNSAGDTIRTAKVILPFKDRLVLFNVVERISGVDQTFSNRVRFSQNGDPTAADAFREDIPGRGDFLDAPTRECIVGAYFLNDRIIVYFDSSVWELVYTQSEVLPFRWQRINAEMGAVSTYSVIPFDKVLLAISPVGVTACSGVRVERIDNKVPDEVFNVSYQNSGLATVNGIRDFFSEICYWTFPNQNAITDFPNKLFVYNYKNGSYAFFDDTFSCFGHYFNTSSPIAGTNQYNRVLAGTYTGFVVAMASAVEASPSLLNAPSMQISNMTYTLTAATLTIVDNNLLVNEYIYIDAVQGVSGLTGAPHRVSIVAGSLVTIVLNAGEVLSGTYTGGGVVGRVSRIDIFTKQFGFYMEQGRNTYISKIDFYLKATLTGAVSVDAFPSSSAVPLAPLFGTNELETAPYTGNLLEATQQRLYHPMYFQSEGEVVQFRIYLSDGQMIDDLKPFENFELESMVIHAMPTSRLQ